jgi:UDP-2,4-diacetamido-2,4,6-trideoxy-beta-L-altropyranose hydrolase
VARLRQVKEQTGGFSMIQLHSDLPTLAPLILKADLAIGAGGTTNWERCCLGLPSLVITVAENQRAVCRYLHQMGLIEWLGDAETITIDQLSFSIQRVLTHVGIKHWSELCMSVCAGKGTAQVINTLYKYQKINKEAITLHYS